MTIEIQMHVDEAFASSVYTPGSERTNPVTGGRFIQGFDPIVPQTRRATRALEARAWFEAHKPADAPLLPLTQGERESLKVGGLAYLVSLFARSLAYRDYQIHGHPHFDTYACGCFASGLLPPHVQNDSVLLERFPPAELKGLGGGLICR